MNQAHRHETIFNIAGQRAYIYRVAGNFIPKEITITQRVIRASF